MRSYTILSVDRSGQLLQAVVSSGNTELLSAPSDCSQCPRQRLHAVLQQAIQRLAQHTRPATQPLTNIFRPGSPVCQSGVTTVMHFLKKGFKIRNLTRKLGRSKYSNDI